MMDCEKGQTDIKQINLLKDMALKDVFNEVGATVQVGKRQDTFWIALAILTTGLLVVKSVFSKKKRR